MSQNFWGAGIANLSRREIVDESDVYVDVHKAIRRLTPAPRARRAQIETHIETHETHIESPLSAAAESKAHNESPVLVEITPSTPREPEVGSYHSNYEGGFHRSAKTAIHMKRRTSDGGIEGPPVLVKASLDEMRQNLRLGPANRATNPLSNTRGALFKIKQGLEAGKSQPSRPAANLGLLNRHYGTSIGEHTPLLVPTFDGGDDEIEDVPKTNGNGSRGRT